MSLRPLILVAALLSSLIIFGLLVDPQRASGAERIDLACPNGLPVFLEGTAPPQTALVVFLAERPVGGGSTDGRGAYRIPITLGERPGIYAIDVRTRTERADVGRFTCYVDVPLANVPTPTPEIVVTAEQPGTPNSPTLTPPTGTPTPTLTPAPNPGGNGSATNTPNPTAGTPTLTPSITPTDAAEEDASERDVEIVAIVRREPGQELDPQAEFVSITNNETQSVNLTNWRIINTSSANQETYIFPRYALGPGLTVTIYSGVGTNNPVDNVFFWGRNGNIWNNGNVAELLNSGGIAIDSYTVGQP